MHFSCCCGMDFKNAFARLEAGMFTRNPQIGSTTSKLIINYQAKFFELRFKGFKVKCLKGTEGQNIMHTIPLGRYV